MGGPEPPNRWASVRTAATQPDRALRRCPSHVLGTRTLGALADFEFDAVTLAEVVDPLTVDGTLVEEELLARLILDEPEPLVDPQRSNRSRHPTSDAFTIARTRNVRLERPPELFRPPLAARQAVRRPQ